MQQPPWPLVNGGGSTPGRAENEVTVNRRHLAEGLRFAVPLHMLELRDVPADRRRFYLPPGGLEALGFGDVLMFKGGASKTFVRTFDAYARTLAILAFEPAGVTLFDAHFCTAPHEGCPHDWTPREPVDGRALWAQFHAILDEYEALLDAEDGDTIPAPRRETVPRTRRPARAPRVVDVPTGSVL